MSNINIIDYLNDKMRLVEYLNTETTAKIIEVEQRKKELIEEKEAITIDTLIENSEDISELERVNFSINRWETTSKDFLEVLEYQIKEMNENKEKIDSILKFNPLFQTKDSFIDLLSKVEEAIDIDDMERLLDVCNELNIKLKYSLKDIEKLNSNLIGVRLQYRKSCKINMTNKEYEEKIKEIKAYLKPVSESYEKMNDLKSEFEKSLEKNIEKVKERKQKILDDLKKSTLEPIEEEIDNENHKIDILNEINEKIARIYFLYENLNENIDQEKVNEIITLLHELNIISSSEVKRITYIKEENKEIKEEKPSKEQKKEIIPTKEVKTLNSDYFRDKDAKNIFCFIGEDGDDIIADIFKKYDKSNMSNALSKLCEIFDELSFKKDYINDMGANPHAGTDKKALKLLEEPFNFAYRRFGTSEKNFRIHAIWRHSPFLEELGYGKGNILFLGAVGLSDRSVKSDNYEDLGRRAIEKMSDKAATAKLRPNFDYIEHITRGYIPIGLLSAEDKVKYDNGSLLCRIKGEARKPAIEDKRYILYLAIDKQSMDNVRKYLDDYFISQTNKVFEIKDIYSKIKRNTIA